MNAHKPKQKIMPDHFVRKATIYLNQSSRQQLKIYASSKMDAQPHQVQFHAENQIHNQKPRRNLYQVINAEQTRKTSHRTEGVSPLCIPSTATRGI